MKAGNLKIFIVIFSLFFFKIDNVKSEEKINLNVLQPTFEEEPEISNPPSDEISKIKSKNKKIIAGRESIVKIRALDKITAKTKDINIVIGKKKRFGYLEIFPRKCNLYEDNNNKGYAAYLQVVDLSDKKEDKIFVFNGWTFSTSTNLKTFDHPIYDLWVTGCENI